MNKGDRAAFFKTRQRLYKKDIVLFFREVLNYEPDGWQAEVARDVVEYPRVTVRSGQGVGKTALEAAILLWFLCCFPYARIVATAPTRQQLNDVLWSEVAKWQSRSPLLKEILRCTKTYIYMVGKEKQWYAVARTATRAENMQGFHADNMLFIVDEASGVADPIMEAILGTLSGDNNKLLMCGNPTKTNGTFFDSHKADRGMYRAHKVSSADSPRTNKDNIDALIRKYGNESNVVRVRVYGEFPLADDDVFIPLALIEASMHADVEEDEEITNIVIGCDVARFGDDKTIIGYKLNKHIYFEKKINGQDTMRTAADIVMLGQRLRKEHGYRRKIPLRIDVGGIGGGVVDRLNQIRKSEPDRYAWMDVRPISFGARIKDRDYYDSTTLMMATLKNMLLQHDEDGNKKPVEIILPNDDDLLAQLSCRKYDITDDNRLRIESKATMKKRNLPSPDEADCVLLLCYDDKPTAAAPPKEMLAKDSYWR